MSLEDRAKAAREHADVCINPSCHMVANALEGALYAERHPPPPPANTVGILPWSAVSAPDPTEGDAD
jgi:hypothetical protein